MPSMQSSDSVDMSSETVASEGCDVSHDSKETQSASSTPIRQVKV